MEKICSVNTVNAAIKRREYLESAIEKEENKITISYGNSKMGKIPSFSVLPIITCANCGACSKWCYACKGCFNFNANIEKLADNTAALIKDYYAVFKAIDDVLKTGKYSAFRFNVAGDVFNIRYLNVVTLTAAKNPAVDVLVFTKNYDLFNNYFSKNGAPKNLHVVFFRWDNAKIENPHGLPVAIVKINDDTEIPAGAHRCGGDCVSCLKCFKAERGETVYFDLH